MAKTVLKKIGYIKDFEIKTFSDYKSSTQALTNQYGSRTHDITNKSNNLISSVSTDSTNTSAKKRKSTSTGNNKESGPKHKKLFSEDDKWGEEEEVK